MQIKEAAQYSTDYCGSETANIVAHSDVTVMVAFALGNTVLACPTIMLHEYLESGKGLAVGKYEIRGALEGIIATGMFVVRSKRMLLIL